MNKVRWGYKAAFVWLVDDEAVFSYGGEDNPRFFYMTADAWESLGEPRTIGLTIEPLNG